MGKATGLAVRIPGTLPGINSTSEIPSPKAMAAGVEDLVGLKQLTKEKLCELNRAYTDQLDAVRRIVADIEEDLLLSWTQKVCLDDAESSFRFGDLEVSIKDIWMGQPLTVGKAKSLEIKAW